MIRALSLAAALAVAPFSAAVAEEQKTRAEVQLDAAVAEFEAKMEEFAERAETIGDDPRLSDDEKEARLEALWAQYEPRVSAFTAMATRQAGLIAEQALAAVDIEAVVAEAVAGVGPMAHGLATNGAWADGDPEHMVTYGLLAQYGMDQALEELDNAHEALRALPSPPEAPEPPAAPVAVI